MNTSDPNDPLWMLFCFALVMIGLIYWIPSFIAFARQHPHRWFILAFNFLAIGTVIGWFIAFAWSLSTPKIK